MALKVENNDNEENNLKNGNWEFFKEKHESSYSGNSQNLKQDLKNPHQNKS